MPEIPTVPSHWTFPAHPLSVSRARRAIADVLPPQLNDDLGLLTSELVTNALRYGAVPADDHVIELVTWCGDGHCWVAVSDAGARLPAPSTPGLEACGGRGLFLVDAISSAWGVVPRRTAGKSVVAGVRLGGGR